MRKAKAGSARVVERIDDGAEADERVLDHLARLGCDPRAPCETSHYLYLPGPDGAAAVAAALDRDGWLTRIEAGEEAPSSLVVATRTRALTPELVRETRRALERLAADHCGVYDGWEAKAAPPEELS